MKDQPANERGTEAGGRKEPPVGRERLALVMNGASAMFMIAAATLFRADAPAWGDLEWTERGMMIVSAAAAVCYALFALMWIRQKRVYPDGARRPAAWPAGWVTVSVLVVLGLAAVPWTRWPFDVSFRIERGQFEAFARSGVPYDGTIRIENIISRTHFETEAGPLFYSVPRSPSRVGYLYRPEGPPPEHTTTAVADTSGKAGRRGLRFTEVYPLSGGWYAVVWRWEEVQVGTLLTSSATRPVAPADFSWRPTTMCPSITSSTPIRRSI